MSGNARWIRLNVGWSSSDWIVVLRPAARLAWVELLAYTKVHGKSGRVKALSALAAGKKWGIPTKDVQAMLDAAHAGDEPALETEDGDWKVCNWSTYQEPDRTSADRQARFRDRQTVTPHNAPVTEHNGVLQENGGSSTGDDADSVTDHNAVTPPLFVTRPLTTDRTSTAAREARPKRWRVCPTGWNPNEEHAALAAELHVNMAFEATKFRDHEFDKPKTDPDRTFANWLRTAATYRNGGTNGNGARRAPKPRKIGKGGVILTP